MMQAHELDAWLGDFPATDDQRAALHRASDMIEARYIDDDGDAAEEAFTIAYQIIVGNLEVTK